MMTYHQLTDYAADLLEEEAACYRDACREAVDEFIGDRYLRAVYLAIAAAGRENFTDWREASYDTPSIRELVELAIEFESVEDLARKVAEVETVATLDELAERWGVER